MAATADSAITDTMAAATRIRRHLCDGAIPSLCQPLSVANFPLRYRFAT